jgi:predicted ATP-dependent endonuclease of OLD family
MKIKSIKIHNWRSIKDLGLSFENFVIFIGQNNCGKSNILSALLFFFGYINCGELDFNKGSDEIYIEIEFEQLDEHDAAQFKKYLTKSGSIKVRKQIAKAGTFEYHGYCQIPVDDWLKEEKISDYAKREVADLTPLKDYLPTTGRLTKDILKTAQEKYFANHGSELQFNYELEVSNFLGAKSVAQGIFGEVFFIPAVKNANEEFNTKGKSIFNQLLTNVINEMSSSNQAYQNAKSKVIELTQNLNKTVADGSVNTNRPEQIASLEKVLEAELKRWNTKIDIEITPPDIDDILKVGTNVWIDDGVSTDVNRKGNGLQRSLIFALIKSWVKVSRETANKIVPEDESKRGVSKSTYFIFEEPELYLHPQAQRELYSSLKELSEGNNQVLISTHSSAFIDLEMQKSICIIYKNSIEEGTLALQCNEELFSLEDDKKNFNMSYWINPDRGELFFAKKVILLEGATDKTVIPFLAQTLAIFRYDYTLIDCGGKRNIPTYLHLLNKFKLPYIAVYDRDHQSGKDQDKLNVADKDSEKIESLIDSNLGRSVVLDNDIEEEVGIFDENKKSKPYIALEQVSGSGFVFSEQLKEKIKKIYE